MIETLSLMLKNSLEVVVAGTKTQTQTNDKFNGHDTTLQVPTNIESVTVSIEEKMIRK